MKKEKIKKGLKIFLSKNFFLYIFLGGLATLLDWGSFAIGVYILDLHYVLSVIVSFCVGAISNFSLNKYFNFKDDYKKVHYQFFAYLLVALVGLFITILLMYIFIDLLFMEKIISRILTSGIVFIYSFLGHKFFTFNLSKIIR